MNNKIIALLLLYVCLVSGVCADAVDFPVSPSFGDITAQSMAQEARAFSVLPNTNGYVVNTSKGDAVVDNRVKPACVFYLNYSSGGRGQVSQYADVQYVSVNCN